MRDRDLGGYGADAKKAVAAVVARIADADRVALAALDRRGHRLGAERHADQALQVADHQPVAGELRAVGSMLR